MMNLTQSELIRLAAWRREHPLITPAEWIERLTDKKARLILRGEQTPAEQQEIEQLRAALEETWDIKRIWERY
jgi:hypothetical protein